MNEMNENKVAREIRSKYISQEPTRCTSGP